MKIKIAKIILWPKDAKKKPRIINFKMSGVEVVTGKSQTGKSSLISIVDYCLGSGKCAIPVGVIRETVEWFGVLLKSPKSEILIARKNPGMQAETSAMYFVKGEEVSIPNSLEGLPSISKEAVLSQLNQLAGLPTLSLSGEDEGGFSGRPSFRDTAAFQFQPQHIVANPHTLFFKADTFEHQEKLKQVFPLVLGAIDNETLELRRRLKVLEAELNQKRGLLEEREKRGAAWLQDFKAFYSQSREYGLLPEALDPQEGWTTETYVSYLLPVPSRLENNSFPAIERGASSRLAREIAALREDEDSTAEKIEDRKRKLSRIERLRTSSDGYSKALVVQGNRLQPISWFAQHVNDGHECPVCGSTTDSATKEVRGLEELAKEVSRTVGSIDSVNHVLDKEASELSEELRKLEDNANDVRDQLSKLDQRSNQLSKQRQTLKDIYSFGGRLTQELGKYAEANKGDTLAQSVRELERKVSDLRSQLNRKGSEQQVRAALASISKSIRHYAQILGVENYDREAEIDIKNLTLVIQGLHGRRDYLWEIGSASNHMGYHLATILSLHEHFLKLTEKSCKPVPQFLFIDQPSQAFFPERWNSKQEQTSDKDPELDSDDIKRVQRIFRALSEAVIRTKNKLQIILIEHVGEADWVGIASVHAIERWRGDQALIPQDWID